MYFLTGENDHYNKQTGVFERVKQTELLLGSQSLRWHGSWPWGLAGCLRYNYLDLNDNGLNGGILNNVTAGLNWFWNPNMKCQFNYMGTHREVSATTNFPQEWLDQWIRCSRCHGLLVFNATQLFSICWNLLESMMRSLRYAY